MIESALTAQLEVRKDGNIAGHEKIRDVLLEQGENVLLAHHEHIVNRQHRLHKIVLFLGKILLGGASLKFTPFKMDAEPVQDGLQARFSLLRAQRHS